MLASSPSAQTDVPEPPKPQRPSDFHRLPADKKLGKRLVILSWLLTLVVWLLVGTMQRLTLPIPDSLDLSILPAINASLNSLVAVCLVAAIYTVLKMKRADLHKRFINAAVVLSIIFLLSYVTYHITHGEVKFGGEGWIRPVYFFLLITHIVLAAVSFPFILLSLSYAVSKQFTKHRKIVKIAFPMWLYVAITGPVVYLLLRQYY